jgi:hypothetical protein
LRSINLYPTHSAYFHIALSFARPGPSQDFKQAIENAGLALQGDPNEIRYWHLLGLLLAATEQWKAAGEILERGAELGEEPGDENEGGDGEGDGEGDRKGGGEDGKDGDQSAHSSIGGETLEADNRTLRRPPSVSINGDGRVDLQDSDHRTAKGNGIPNTKLERNETYSTPSPLYLLENDVTRIPAAASLLMPTPDHDLPSKQDVFEYALQLRMTQAALSEVVEGAEGAELKWVNIFSWHAEKKGTGSESTFLFTLSKILSGTSYSHLTIEATPRPSMDGSRSSPDKSASFAVTPSLTSSDHTHAQALHHAEKEALSNLQPIPITISPAPPDTEQRSVRTSSEKSEKKSYGGLRVKRSTSIDRDTSTSKKVQQMLKNRVDKGRAGITTISRKIGSGVVKNGSPKRSNSTPGKLFSFASER